MREPPLGGVLVGERRGGEGRGMGRREGGKERGTCSLLLQL